MIKGNKMCKNIDAVDEKLQILINNILENEQEYTLEAIYDYLDKANIEARRYRAGVTIKDYFDLLISNEIIECRDKRYVSPNSINQAFATL